MMELGRHGGFILASYTVTLVILGGFVWHSVRRYMQAKRRFGERLGPDNG